MTSKVAKNIALSIAREFHGFTCLEGSVIGVVVHIMFIYIRRLEKNGPTTSTEIYTVRNWEIRCLW